MDVHKTQHKVVAGHQIAWYDPIRSNRRQHEGPKIDKNEMGEQPTAGYNKRHHPHLTRPDSANKFHNNVQKREFTVARNVVGERT